jgi:hypothetical protein
MGNPSAGLRWLLAGWLELIKKVPLDLSVFGIISCGHLGATLE